MGPLGLRQKYDEDLLNGNRSQHLDQRFKSAKGFPNASRVGNQSVRLLADRLQVRVLPGEPIADFSISLIEQEHSVHYQRIRM